MDTISLHHQAEDLREDDKLLDALKLYEEVLMGYGLENNHSGIADALGGRCLTYKHLFLNTNNSSFLTLATHDASASMDIASKNNLSDLLYRCYFRLGEMANLAKKYDDSINYYEQSLKHFSQADSEKGDIIQHLGEAQIQNGQKELGIKNLLLGLKTIRQYASVTDSFLVHVWESGCLLKLAYFTKDMKYLAEAEKIINSDDRLVIRKRQLAEFKSKIK